MALRSPHVNVRAITLYTTELCGADVPVFPGAEQPLIREYMHAQWFHGRDGLGDHNYPPPSRKPESTHAVEAIIETIRANPGIVLVTLGPLTNVALALARAPEIAVNVSRAVVMGGAPCCEGNVTPAAEYNIWVDPDAARIVARSGLPIELVGWQLCRGPAALDPADIQHTLALNTPLARSPCPSPSTPPSAPSPASTISTSKPQAISPAA